MGQINSCLTGIFLPVTVLAAACKPATPNGKGASNSAVSLLKRPASARLVRPISGGRGKSFLFALPYLKFNCMHLINYVL